MLNRYIQYNQWIIVLGHQIDRTPNLDASIKAITTTYMTFFHRHSLTMAKLLKNGTVITFDNTTETIKVLPKASILIVNDRIAAITENDDPPLPENTTVIDVHGKIITPGFINTHIHMWQTVYRSMGPNVTLAEYFSWVSQRSPATALFTPDNIHTSCLEGYMEGLHAGVTSFVEHAHNNWSAGAVEPGLDAAVQSGARVWWCYDVMQRDGFSRSEQWEALERVGRLIGPDSLVQMGLAVDGLSGFFGGDPDGHVGHAREMIKYVPYPIHTYPSGPGGRMANEAEN